MDAHTHVPVSAAMLWPTFDGVWTRQLHQVYHLRPDPQPGTAVWQLVIWAVVVEVKAERVTVELQRPLQVVHEKADVVHAMENAPLYSRPWNTQFLLSTRATASSKRNEQVEAQELP